MMALHLRPVKYCLLIETRLDVTGSEKTQLLNPTEHRAQKGGPMTRFPARVDFRSNTQGTPTTFIRPTTRNRLLKAW